jgi:hypothetical protein
MAAGLFRDILTCKPIDPRYGVKTPMNGSRLNALPRPLADAHSRRAVLAAGGAAALTVLAGANAAGAATHSQSGWRYCEKCRGLFLPISETVRKRGKKKKRLDLGVCPAGGKHLPLQTHDYILYFQEITLGIIEVFRCEKCNGLVQTHLSVGVCPSGGGHTPVGPEFALWTGSGIRGVTDDAWDFCSKCRGVFNWAGGAGGVCPQGNGHLRGGETIKLVLRW